MSADILKTNKLSKEYFGLKSELARPLVCVQGLGFVGAAMSVAVAQAMDSDGKKIFDVLGVDLPTTQGKARAEAIRSGNFPFSSGDEKLERETKACHEDGNLSATTESSAFALADIVVIDVNLDVDFSETPPVAVFDNYVRAISTVGRFVAPNALIIVETTVPPGTCERIVLPALQRTFKNRGLNPKKILLAHSYERVMPGPGYLDSIVNYWRVYAGICEDAADLCETFLEKIIDTDNFPLRRLSSTTASETAKIMENTYRAANIALIDEWGVFAENIGVDIFEIIDAIRDRPTHSNIRQPGFGVGGYCLTKDPSFANIANNTFFKKNSVAFPVAELAMTINSQMPIRNLNRILSIVDKEPEQIKMLMLGVAYRSEVDDTRFSASETFYRQAIARGIDVQVHDPHVKRWEEVGIDIETSLPNADFSDVVVFCVPHKFYQTIIFSDWLSDKSIIVYDCDKVLSEKQITEIALTGIRVEGTGRGKI